MMEREGNDSRHNGAPSNGGGTFEHGVTSITFPRSLSSARLRRTLRGAQSLEAWTSSVPARGFVGSVRRVIGALLRARRPDIRLVAEMGGMGVRTLQRRLAEAGVSFARLVAEARLDKAVRLLEDPGIKLVDIALELGFSDHAHFTRAFRQWTGIAPREFRRLRERQSLLRVRSPRDHR